MEESEEFKWAVKVVIKRQMRDLINQLKESGEEIALMSVNLDDESCSLLGTPNGEWFLSEQKNLSTTFLSFCKNKTKKNGKGTVSSDWLADGSRGSPHLAIPGTSQKTDGTRRYSPGRKPKHLVEEPEPVIIRVTIPLDMVPEVPEEELASLVLRLFAAKVVSGKLNLLVTRFDEIKDALSLRDMKYMKTPSKKQKLNSGEAKARSTTRSGRKVSNKFLEGINSLKKVKIEEVASVEKSSGDYMEGTPEEKAEDISNLIEELYDLDVMAMKRFTVCTSDEEPLDVLKIGLTQTAEIESIVAPLIRAIDRAVPKATMLGMKKVQLIVAKEETSSNVITVEMHQAEAPQKQSTDKPDQPDVSADDENDEEASMDDQDPGIKEAAKELENKLMEALSSASEATPTPGAMLGPVEQAGESIEQPKLIRRPKKRAATELMLMKCPECGISVTGKSNLTSHIKRIHMNVRNFECSICNKGFWSNNARESHMLAVHTRKCESCQEYVVESVPWGRNVDMKTKRDVICTCGAIVSIFSTFGRRRMYLRDDEPDEEGNVRSPRPKSNTGTKFACGTCGKLFMKKSNCERHSRAHTDMKLCVCDLCGVAYSYESSLKKHLAAEHGIVKHVCEICGGNYGNLTALKVHMVRAHHNVAIGDNVAIVVQPKDGVDEDLEEFQQSLQGKHEGSGEHHTESMDEEGSSREADGSQKDQVYIQTSSGQFLMSSAEAELFREHTDQQKRPEAQEQIMMGEGSGQQQQRVVISTEGEVMSSDTSEIVQEVLRSGQLMAQEGGMSIIIKQVPMENADIQKHL